MNKNFTPAGSGHGIEMIEGDNDAPWRPAGGLVGTRFSGPCDHCTDGRREG